MAEFAFAAGGPLANVLAVCVLVTLLRDVLPATVVAVASLVQVLSLVVGAGFPGFPGEPSDLQRMVAAIRSR